MLINLLNFCRMLINGVDYCPRVLPDGVAQCESFNRSSSVSKRVTLLTETDSDLAKSVCQLVDSHLVSETRKRPLGSEYVRVSIAQFLEEVEIVVGWIYSIFAWPITRVLLNGASLYNQDQCAIFSAAVNALGWPARNGVRQYESTSERRPRDSPLKMVYFLTSESINFVATTTCRPKNCIEPFPWGKIKDLGFQFYVCGDVFFRKHRIFNVHGQVHEDAYGNDMIMLEDIKVCCVDYYLIMGVSRATFFQWRLAYQNG